MEISENSRVIYLFIGSQIIVYTEYKSKIQFKRYLSLVRIDIL